MVVLVVADINHLLHFIWMVLEMVMHQVQVAVVLALVQQLEVLVAHMELLVA
jgi:hypothetical protein